MEKSISNPVLYVILNKQLNMSPGKAAAQTAQVVMMLEDKYRDIFMSNYRRTVIVLEADGFEQLHGITDYLYDAGIEHDYYVDEGVNEMAPFSTTALVVEPIDRDDTEKREIFAGLNLYGSNSYNDSYEQTDGDKVAIELRAIRSLLTPPVEKPKTKWYKRLFKRKPNGFVS